MSLYQDQLLALSKEIAPRGDPAECPRHAFRRNPACGDEIGLGLRVEEDRVAGLCHKVRGCAVCRASAAVLARAIEGQPLGQARERLAQAMAFFASDAEWTAAWGREDMPALGAVRARPMRMACVRLPWAALEEVLETT